jgi:uncharacterized membrane protein YcfT
MTGVTRGQRIDWVDYAKGICIVLVVMMHSTIGLENAAGAQGWMHHVVEFAKPFRMPDFFLISGLFVASVIDRDWKTYLDRKVVHFAYFYLLWMTIQFAFKAPALAHGEGVQELARVYALSLIEPFGTLWFIYLLPIFFVVVKLTRRVPVWIMWPLAAALEISHFHGEWTVPGEFAQRFVYFYSGYVLAPHVFKLAKRVQDNPWNGVVMLALWAPVNTAFVLMGWATLPFVSLALGFLGAAAVVRMGALMSLSNGFAFVRYCGQHSLIIYLAFFLPMATMRTILLKTGIITDLGTEALVITAAGVLGPLVLFWLVRWTPARFLFERPRMFWLASKPRPRFAVQAAN